MSRSSARQGKAFENLIRRCGVRRITFKGLRHTHISHQLMDRVHIKIVSEPWSGGA